MAGVCVCVFSWALCIGIDFWGGQPGRAPPKKNRETPMHLSGFTTISPPKNYVCLSNILTSLCRWLCVLGVLSEQAQQQ